METSFKMHDGNIHAFTLTLPDLRWQTLAGSGNCLQQGESQVYIPVGTNKLEIAEKALCVQWRLVLLNLYPSIQICPSPEPMVSASDKALSI